jgi:hypothetical protein
MGLKGDVDEVTKAWSSASPLGKVWLGLSLFFGISALASLSELVTKWKGLIKDGVEFYHVWIGTPIREAVAAWTGLQLDKTSADFMLLMLFLTASWQRSVVIGTDWSDRRERIGTLAGLTFCLVFYLISLFGLSRTGAGDGITWQVIVGSIASFGIFPWFGSNRKFAMLHFIQVLVCCLLVGILAAVNTGLQQ